MALSAATLRTEILKRTDASRADFSGWPATAAAAVTSWAEAARVYFAELVNPVLLPPAASALAVAAAAFEAAAGLELDSNGRLTADALPVGFEAFAAALLPAAGYVVTPPAPTGGLSDQGAPMAWEWPDGWDVPTSDPNPFADLLSGLVDLWARTGTASVPPATPAPWS